MTTRNIVPRADGEGQLGRTDKKWNKVIAYDVEASSIKSYGAVYINGSEEVATKAAVEALGSGSPAGVYATTAELASAITTPEGRAKIYLVTADGKWYYWSGSAWVAGGVYQTPVGTDNSVTPKALTVKPVFGSNSRNLFNKHLVTHGYFISCADGTLSANAGFVYTDYLPLTPGTQFAVRDGIAQFAYYNSSKVYVSGVAKSDAITPTVYTVPENVSYARFSVALIFLDIAQIELNDIFTPYIAAKVVQTVDIDDGAITPDKLSDHGMTLTVSPIGGNYTTLYGAVQKAISMAAPCTIEIYPGTYDIISEINAATAAAAGEIILPDNCNLIGIGDRDSIIIKGAQAADADPAHVSAYATLRLQYNHRIENLTITAQQMRYAVHDESGGVETGWTRIVKNCMFIHYGNEAGYWSSDVAWGEGSSSGSYSEFTDCIFVGHNNLAYLYHNNVDFTKESRHKFINCDFISHADVSYDCVFQSYDKSVVDRVDMINCRHSHGIALKPTGGYTGANAIIVTGCGNSKAPQTIELLTASAEDYIKFSDETLYLKNNTASPIAAGTTCVRDGMNGVRPMTASDDAALFAGVAYATIPINNYGVVKTKGYIQLSRVGVTAAAGSKVGIISGALAVVTTEPHIGIVPMTGHLLLL